MSAYVRYPPNNIVPLTCDSSEVSDGYHTFGELYAHRCRLFALLMVTFDGNAFKTRRNAEGDEWEGWFIGGMDTPAGQITYHLPAEMWDMLPTVREIERNAGYDGHTSDDVLARLDKLIQNQAVANA